MHPKQFSDFSDLHPIPTPTGFLLEHPFIIDGMTYASDRAVVIRYPDHIEGYPDSVDGFMTVNADDEKLGPCARGVPMAFEFFTQPLGTLVPLAALVIEPVIARRRGYLSWDDYDDDGAVQRKKELYVALSSPIKIDGRLFDARRLLYMRQTLPNLHYYAEPDAPFDRPLYFVFGEKHEGQGVLMPMKPGNLSVHWNGTKYYPDKP